jgi:hypothetical protein
VLARGMQAQPAHRPVHAVHVDDDVIGLAFLHQLPAATAGRVRLLEGRAQFGLGRGIHAGGAERQSHVSRSGTLQERAV